MKYRYGLQYRPASVGAVPVGPYEIKARLSSPEGARCTQHGVIVYRRPLRTEEIRSFQLVVLADELLRNEIAVELAAKMQEFAVPYLEIWGEAPQEFRVMLMARAQYVRPYPVYLGETLDFCRQVAELLEASIDDGSVVAESC